MTVEREEIQAKFDRAANLTLQKCFPEIQQQVLLSWRRAIEDSEMGWLALEQFGVEHNVKLSYYAHHGGLSPRRADKDLQRRLEDLID